MTTSQKAQVQFTLPELNKSKLITYSVHLATQLMNYDMIMGRDLLQELGININFKNMTLEWDNNIIEMKSTDATEETSFAINDSPAVTVTLEQLKHILDAKYEAANLEGVIKTHKLLNDDEQAQLLALLEKYSDLFLWHFRTLDK